MIDTSKYVPASDLQKKIGEVFKLLETEKYLIVTKNGKPTTVLLDIDTYNSLTKKSIWPLNQKDTHPRIPFNTGLDKKDI